jgi:pentatricopeptide repeat protein
VGLLEEAVRLAPNNSVAYLGLGAALGVKGDRDRAIEHLERAIQLAPRNASTYRLLGDTLELAGRVQEAEETLKKALPILTSNDGPTFAALIRVLIRQGKDQDADELLERMIRIPPSPLRTHAFNLYNLLALHPWDQAATLPIPAPPTELAELASYCRRELEFEGSAARLSIWAFAADPRLLDDRVKLRRFNAACSALRAGKGLGNDSYRTSKVNRIALARQGLLWLENELTELDRLANGNPRERSEAKRILLEWEKPRALPSDLEGTDADGLSTEERAAFGRLRAKAKGLLLSLNRQLGD